MKYLLILFASSLLGCNVASKTAIVNTETNNSKGKYQVLKIDSIKDIYLIYARRDGQVHKIMSIRDSLKDCRNIQVGEFYNLQLKSYFEHDTVLMVATKMQMGGKLHNGTTVPIEEKAAIRDIFYDRNLKGLCLDIN